MSEKIDYKNYEVFIRLKGRGKAKGIMNEFLLNGPLGKGEPLIINRDDSWSFCVDKRKRHIYDEFGLEFFKDEAKFNKYAKDFREYNAHVSKHIIPQYSKIPTQITRQEFKAVIEKVAEFWYFYGMTEYVFHDHAYEKMSTTRDKILEKNLKGLDSLKLEGRKIFNALAFIDGVVDNILRHISRQYLENDDGYFLRLSEIENLFDGIRLPQQVIEERKRCYAILGKHHFSFSESEIIAEEFSRYEELEFERAKNELKGMVANKGIAVGKVVISPMWDREEAARIAENMTKGDILVVQSTNPELMALCHKAGAIVTNQGGMLSHAAIISRELNIPCIVGTINATKIFKDGDLIEVDADRGVVKIIEIA
jgi:phosphohistidine swiveling domain-containing protein